MTFGQRGNRQRFVNHFQRRNAHRTAGAVHQFDVGGKHFINAIAHQRVRLAAANLHQHPVPGNTPRDFRNERPGKAGITILVEVLHKKSVASDE